MLRCVSQRLISPHFRAISSSLGLFISLCLFFVCKIQLVLNSFRWVPLVAKYHTMIMQHCSFLHRLSFVSEKNCVVFERFLQEPVQAAQNYSQNLYDNFIFLLLRINLLYSLCWHLQEKNINSSFVIVQSKISSLLNIGRVCNGIGMNCKGCAYISSLLKKICRSRSFWRRRRSGWRRHPTECP